MKYLPQLAVAATAMACVYTPFAQAQGVPEWVQHYEWSKHNNEGSEPHDGTILELAPHCFVTGKHPACLWAAARDAAKANNCDRAMRLMRESQGHSGHAQDVLQQAASSVCARLKSE